MPKNLRWKWIVIVLMVAGCLLALQTGGVRLGLDLKGGSHIVLQIQVEDAFKAEADHAVEQLKDSLGKEQIAPEAIEPAAAAAQISIRGVQTSQAAVLRRVVTETLGQSWALTEDGATGYRLDLRQDAAIKLREETIAQTVATLEKKVNGLGVAEASVQQRGGSEGEAEIVVQLPGVDDPARVKAVLQTAALLELCEVKGGPYQSRDAALSANNGSLPMNSRLVRQSSSAGDGGGEAWWILGRNAVITGRDLRNARAQQNPTNQSWETSFMLTQEAAGKFGRFTGAHIGGRLAIVLDKLVLSAPTIESQIGDSGVINNMGSMEEATDLALNLRAGSLPASLKLTEERTVGPSLGADSIRRGLTAGIAGLALVVASMIAYYRGAGGNAVLALLLNTLMTLAALSYIDATWTLPGIAGLVLSIGMAVDSNVLIFERIKEEMRAGKTVAAAIPAGFDRALVTIIDTHVTTVVASAFLFVFGTGPVRGFAVTLVVGLVANLFTAVFVSRAIFDVKLWRSPRLATLSIGKELFKQTNIDFLSKRAFTLGLSVLAIAVSIASLAIKGGPRYGLDFRGGTQMYVRFDPKPPIDEIRRALSTKLDVSLQETPGTSEFIIETGLAGEESLDQARHNVENALRETYANLGGKLDLNNATQAALEERLQGAPSGLAERILSYRDREKGGIIRDLGELAQVPGVDAKILSAIRQECGLSNFNIRSVEIVGPRAGAQLRQQAALATAGALGGMLIYIAFRFQLISGAAAVIATIHDVIVTLGLFSLTNREIDLTIVAALLTLIGYSMNDKIVVFDRVRENLRKAKPGASFLDLVNQSINQTLSRTLLTAGPTLLACLSLYFLGGEVLNGIAFALFAGIVVGTYSSIFVASALLVMWEQRQPDVQRPVQIA